MAPSESMPERLVIWRKNKKTGHTKQFLYVTCDEPRAQSVAELLNAGNKTFNHYVLKEFVNEEE